MKFCKIKVVKKALIQYNSNCSRICLLVFAFFLMSYSLSIAQVNAECFEGGAGIEGTYHNLYTNFEDNYEHYSSITSAINPWVIDSSNQNNIWQISMPQKLILDSAYSTPYCLTTDTLLPYPSNNRSVFYTKFCSSLYPYPLRLSGIFLVFRCKFNTDSLRDGFYIEISYNGGSSWTNILNDETPIVKYYYRFYGSTDSLYNGESGFSGSSYGSVSNVYGWALPGLNYTYNQEIIVPLESIMLRFVFISDSIDNNLEGVLIDDIRITIMGFWNNVEETSLNNFFSLFPNPTNDVVQLKLDEKYFESNCKVVLYDIIGLKVFETHIMSNESTIDVSNFNKGIYLLKIESNKGILTKKLIIN